MYKNIEKQTKLQLKDQIDYQPGQVVSKTLVQNDKVSMTIFSFDKDEEIFTHAAGGDAMVTVLEGAGLCRLLNVGQCNDIYLLIYLFLTSFAYNIKKTKLQRYAVT